MTLDKFLSRQNDKTGFLFSNGLLQLSDVSFEYWHVISGSVLSSIIMGSLLSSDDARRKIPILDVL